VTPPPPPPPEPGVGAGALALPAPSALQLIRARGRLRGTLPLLGAAFVASIAYVDPGNFATNVQGGAKYGYLLLWVVLVANLMAMLVQYLSAKIGVVTDRNLPELCRDTFPRPTVWALWIQAEIMAMATDLAEVVGGAIALNILFGVPLLPGGVIVGIAAFAILVLRERGHRRFELTIGAMLGVILVAFLYDTLQVGGDPGGIARGFLPSFGGSGSILLATGILGATIMPHVIYLHSALTQNRIPARDDGERRQLLRFQRLDVGVAMGMAGLVNLAMLVVVASVFHHPGMHVDSIQGAHDGFATLVGPGAALAFALGLLISGLAASSVGTQAGQVVMQGFIHRKIPLVLRRLVTMAPALAILAVGLDPTRALVLSQVVLSFGIPFALVPLVILTGRRDVMGAFVNRRLTSVVAYVIAALLVALNGFLIAQTLLG
jgi:manganese transport protein